MRVVRVLSDLISGVADILAPDLCHLCGTRPGDDVSDRRLSEVAGAVRTPVRVGVLGFTVESHPLCSGCVEALVATECPSQIHSTCHTLDVITPFYSNARLLELIHLLKFRRYRHAVGGLALAMARAVARQGPVQADILVPVPMDARSRRRRGFNQAELLATELSRLLDIPMAADGLIKRRRTNIQSLLPVDRRPGNVRGAFEARKSLVRTLRVALVDDLVTSGATAIACADVLRAAGACPIAVFASGRTGDRARSRDVDQAPLRQS